MELPPQRIILISVSNFRYNVVSLLQETLNSLLDSEYNFRVVIYLSKTHHHHLNDLKPNKYRTIELIDNQSSFGYSSMIDNYRSFIENSKCRPLDWIIFVEPGDLLLPYGLYPLASSELGNGYIGRALQVKGKYWNEVQSLTFKKLYNFLTDHSTELHETPCLSGTALRFEWFVSVFKAVNRTFGFSSGFSSGVSNSADSIMDMIVKSVPEVSEWTDYPLFFNRTLPIVFSNPVSSRPLTSPREENLSDHGSLGSSSHYPSTTDLSDFSDLTTFWSSNDNLPLAENPKAIPA